MAFFLPGTYDLFLTHAWNYTDEWQEVVALLDARVPGKWRNWSLPWHDTSIDRHSEDGKAQLEQLLHGHISMTSAVLLLPGTGDRAEGRMWLERELALAAQYGKPVIGVLQAGQARFPADLAGRVVAVVARDAAAILAEVDRRLRSPA